MEYHLSWSDYLIFAFWLAIYSLVGIYQRVRIRTRSSARNNQQVVGDNNKEETAVLESGAKESLFFGDRQLTLFPVTCSVIASFISAISLMGTATEAYRYGFQFILMVIPYTVAFSIAAEVYLPVFYKLRLKSAQEYLEFRFGKSLRLVVAAAFAIQMWAYIALVLYAPALAFSQVSGLPMWITVVSTGLVTTFYTALGGLRAVVWTDVIQLVLLTCGMLLIIVLGIIKVGGLTQLWVISLEGLRLQSFSFDPNPFLRHTFWTLTIGGTGMVLSIYATNQTQVQRYLSCKNLKTARWSLLLNIPFNYIFLVIQMLAGLITYAYFVDCDPVTSKQVKRPDQLLPYFIMVIFDGIPVIRGLFMSIIFAAALSTVSSGVNSLANVVLEDIICPLCNVCRRRQLPTQTSTVMFLSALIGVSTIGLAFLYTTMGPLLLQFSFSIFGAVGGPIFSVYTLGILAPCVNLKGGLVGFVCSLIVGLWLSIGSALYPTISPTLPLSTENCTGFNMTNNSTIGTVGNSFNIYSISYLYYTPICLLVALISALIVSAISGFNSHTPVPSCLLAWQAVTCFKKCPLPSCPPQFLDSDVYIREVRNVSGQENESPKLYMTDTHL